MEYPDRIYVGQEEDGEDAFLVIDGSSVDEVDSNHVDNVAIYQLMSVGAVSVSRKYTESPEMQARKAELDGRS